METRQKLLVQRVGKHTLLIVCVPGTYELVDQKVGEH